MNKRLISLVLVLGILLSLSACGHGGRQPANHGGDVRSFTDDAGRSAELPADLTRIVPSSALGQMILLAIAPDLLVGLASDLPDSGRGILPHGLFELPVFGTLYSSADRNVEELALAGPQLILDIGERKNSTGEDMDALQAQTGIPSVFLSASLETMPQTFRRLGALLGREEKGEELARFCERVYSRTRSVMERVGENKVKALYVLGEEGLNVIAAGSYHGEVMDLLTDNLAVVENPVGKGTGNEVSMEQIALWDPDFIVFGPGSIYGSVTERDTWESMTAVQNGAFVEVPEGPYNWMGMPPSVQRYLSLIWLTAVLYPEYCDYDVKAEILEYYALFYGCTLTEEQYGTITANSFLR